MNAHDYLIRVQYMVELIKAKCAERDQLMTMATSVNAGIDGMPHASGKSDKIGNIAVKLADLANEVNDLVDRYVNLKRDVVSALEKLPPREYLVLHKHYIQGMSWGEVASDMGYCREQIWRIKVKALEMLETCNMM
jgi:DNA-directed RNA polymerase specialized sigma subunit